MEADRETLGVALLYVDALSDREEYNQALPIVIKKLESNLRKGIF